MGIRAQGKRFCIIADRSGSMEGPKVEYVKQEILESLGSMASGARFQLVLYNHTVLPYPNPGWRNPRQDKGNVEQWMKASGRGPNHPYAGVRDCLEPEPRPTRSS
jgi:hypothetical protein